MPLFRKNKSQASLSDPQEHPQPISQRDRIRNRDNNNSYRPSGSAVGESPLPSTTTDFAPPLTPTAQTPHDISTHEYQAAPHPHQHQRQQQYSHSHPQQRHSYVEPGVDSGARRPTNNNNSSDSRNRVRQRFSYISQQLQGKPTLRVVPATNSATAPPSAAVPEESDNQSQNLSANENLNSWPSSPNPESVSPQSGSEPRKSQRSTFGLHSSSSSTNAHLKKGLARGLSVRKKSPVAQQSPGSGRTSESDRSRLSLDYQRPSSGQQHYQQHQQQGHGSDQRLLEQQEDAADPQMPQPSSRRLQSRSPYIHTNNPNRYSSYLPQSPVVQDSAQNLQGNPDPELFYQQGTEVGPSHNQVSSQRLPPYQGDSQQQQPASTAFPPRKSSSSHVTISQFSSDQLSLSSYDPRLDTSIPYPRPGSQQSFGPPSPLNPQFQQSSDSRPQTPNYRRTTLPPPPSQQQSPQQQPSRGEPSQLDGSRQAMDPNQQQQPQQQQQQQHHQHQHQNQQQQQLAPNQNQNAGPYPPPPGGPPQGTSFKSNISQQSITEQGRDTPPPSKGREEEIDAKALLQKHEELQAKYMKVKRYFFERDAQVQQLQNTVAHQRMATSRTVLDDDEYATRFNRLDGAIKDLSFNIRKDWRSIPPWLQPVVNEDAHSVGTKEMTAVGRACITRWLVDEVFDRFFHPGLEPSLSSQLKIIERNVRRTGKIATDEDKENHLARLSTWRRTTIDGLGEVLQSRAAEEHFSNLSHNLVEKLTASLEINLNEPPPPGLQNSVSMIIEIALSIAAKIPMESRDVYVDYPLPGSLVKDACMKVETTLPPLTNPGAEEPPPTERGEHDDQMKDLVGDSDREKDSSSASTGGSAREQQQQGGQPPKEVKKKSVFGNLIGKKTHTGSNSEPGRVGSREAREREELEQRERDRAEKDRENSEARIRFAAFVIVEIKGKGPDVQLNKAPVYPLS